ncbi:MAG: hypothetical protein IPK83_24725 [Planctomycetes bacterium]|nr:hypothetical protein [Planctomycetota bacterium]
MHRIPQSIAAILLLTLLGCAQTQPTLNDEQRTRQRIESTGLTESENETRVAGIADRIEDAYAACSTLSLTATITEPLYPETKRVELAMTPDKLKARIFIDDVPVLVWTLADGRWEEFKSEYNGEPKAHLIRTPESDEGPLDVTLSDGIERHMCGLGGYYQTWLAPDSRRIEYFASRIAKGSWIANEKVHGRQCDVVACLPNERYGGTELIYVRPDGFVARWESIRPTERDGPPKLMRIRTYSNYRTTPLPDATWNLEIPPDPMPPPKSDGPF